MWGIIMERREAEKKLKQIFGFDSFFENQWRVVEKILQKKKILLVEKTGQTAVSKKPIQTYLN